MVAEQPHDIIMHNAWLKFCGGKQDASVIKLKRTVCFNKALCKHKFLKQIILAHCKVVARQHENIIRSDIDKNLQGSNAVSTLEALHSSVITSGNYGRNKHRGCKVSGTSHKFFSTCEWLKRLPVRILLTNIWPDDLLVNTLEGYLGNKQPVTGITSPVYGS